MDPVTQGVLGASLPQAITRNKQQLVIAGLFGALGGMVPDLDVLIRSNADPLLFLEYHRQFTHSLFFVPFGGVMVGVLLYYLLGKWLGIKLLASCVYTTLGYATHALLDACTSYGTLLLWPFSSERFAWNMISVIDPLYTLPLLAGVLMAGIKKQARFAQIALVWALVYPLVGSMQRDRAITAGWELAMSRGHQPDRLEAKPSFGNIVLWKTVYETAQYYYVDAVHVAVKVKHYTGDRAKKLDIAQDFSWLDVDSQQARDIERFRWFSNDYIALDPSNSQRIIDVRYSLIPNEIAPLWGIQLSSAAEADSHITYTTARQLSDQQREAFVRQLLGR
ncbi:MAG: metal-dependent hydrolase [Cellvibrionales bacterium]|nr:metal-dependent hydrolase [Cellvibrionales bacterium]